MHELAHRIRNHKTRDVEISTAGLMLVHDYDKAQEEEADWLSGCLLLPREALISIKQSRRALPDAAIEFGVSQRMLAYRLSMTGVNRQFTKIWKALLLWQPESIRLSYEEQENTETSFAR